MVALGLLGQQHRLDVGQDAALSDGDFAQQLVQLLVVAVSQLQVTRVFLSRAALPPAPKYQASGTPAPPPSTPERRLQPARYSCPCGAGRALALLEIVNQPGKTEFWL